MLSPRSRTPHSARSDAFTPFAVAGQQPPVDAAFVAPRKWEDVCDSVLGSRLHLWDVLFEQVLVQVRPIDLVYGIRPSQLTGEVFQSDDQSVVSKPVN